MEASLFAKILSDKSLLNMKKLRYKYPQADMGELVDLLKASVYRSVPLPDFAGNNLVYLENAAQVRMRSVKLLLAPQSPDESYGLQAMEQEIVSTLTIENIDFSRDSVRKILRGYGPGDESEQRIYGLKKGLEFIADPTNEITEESIHELYETAIGQYLPQADRLQPGSRYRNDSVYIVGQALEHTGLPYNKLPSYMDKLVAFIQTEDAMNDLLKAAIIHFYIAYLHPYFDGNGRMARLLHLWYLRSQGYSSALFVPFSSYIERSRQSYYSAYSLAEENFPISGVMDVTPFLTYFIDRVYHRLENPAPPIETLDVFQKELHSGNITEKERELWNFVLSAYGDHEFSTKQLERDFGHAAYATIRSFVIKFERLGLLSSQRYKNKTKYFI